MTKQATRVFGLDELKEDVKYGITKQVLKPIQDLGEECAHINEALDLLTVQDIMERLLPRIEKRLKVLIKSTKFDPFSYQLFKWPSSLHCEDAEYDENLKVIPGSRCKRVPVIVGCQGDKDLTIYSYCAEHIYEGADWRWYIPWPIPVDILKE